MRIAIDISQIVYEGTGVARFTRGLVETILDQAHGHDWVFFFSGLRRSLDPEIVTAIAKKKCTLVRLPIPPSALSFLWNRLHVLSIDAFVGQVDWVITSDWSEPPSRAKKATIVHDLAFVRYPEAVGAQIKRTQSSRLEWVARESQVVFADSKTTKEDLVELLGLPQQKIVVNYPGVAIGEATHLAVEQTREKYHLVSPFILTVGKVEPRKNLKRLFEAFSEISKKNVDLVVAGPPGWEKPRETPKNVRFLGYVTDLELAALYSSCLGFIYPSVWEGFGYPVIEAMKQGAPVATSKTSSLGEIAGEAALLFDPLNVNEIEQALQKLIDDDTVRRTLTKKGLAQAKKFTWENYYQKMISTLEKY